MRCSRPQLCEVVAPGPRQALIWLEVRVALQGPCQHHLGSVLCRELQGQGCLCIYLTAQAVPVHLRSCRLSGASASRNLQVLSVSLYQKLGVCCCSLRVWRQANGLQGLQDLSNAEERLMHTDGLRVHPSWQDLRPCPQRRRWPSCAPGPLPHRPCLLFQPGPCSLRCTGSRKVCVTACT